MAGHKSGLRTYLLNTPTFSILRPGRVRYAATDGVHQTRDHDIIAGLLRRQRTHRRRQLDLPTDGHACIVVRFQNEP